MSSSTAVPPRVATAGRRMLRPATSAFTIVLALSMAVTALGVDSVLPAFPEIRTAMGLSADSNEVAGLVSFYLLGSSIGLLPFGLLADRFGRRPIMFGGLVVYVAGAVISVFAPSLTLMFVGRFLWGFGSAGPRVGVMAIMRDTYSGDQMAKQMSFMMAVFIMIPAIAPSIGTALLLIGPWQIIFWMCAAFGVVMFAATARIPETLAPEAHVPLDVRGVLGSCRQVLVEPGTVGYLVALTSLFGVFISYIASSEIILDEVFGLKEWFPLYFGAIALVMGAGMTLNGRFVERVGLRRITGQIYSLALGGVVVLLLLALLTDGTPPFVAFVPVIATVMFAFQMLIPNLNAAGMQPLSRVAGTAAAILGMVSGGGGAMIGLVIDRQFNGTITPLAIAMLIGTVISAAGWRWATSHARR